MNKVLKTQIVGSAIDIMSNALKRLSKENQCDATNIQLVIKFDGQRVLYSYMKDYQKISDLTFNEILGVKFDFKQREFLTAPFLQKSIVRLAEEKNVDVNEMSSIIMTKDFKRINIPKLAVLTTEEGIKRIKEFFGKLTEWKNINDLVPLNFTTSKNLKRTGKAGIFSGSLELAKEGDLSIKQEKLFDDVFIKENK